MASEIFEGPLASEVSQAPQEPLPMRTRMLLRKKITYTSAKEKEVNILHQLGYWEKRDQYFTVLFRRSQQIETVVAHHLGVAPENCHAAHWKEWIHGSFNVCIRVDVDGHGRQPGKQYMIRFPLPYRVGETPCPGNADEKVRCEVGTYAWLEKYCPELSIPQLYGFGLSAGQTFTRLDNLPFFTRLFQRLYRQLLQWFNYPVPCPYVAHQPKESFSLGSPYILIEFINSSRGKMLSETWSEGRHDPKLRRNLFHGLSRIILTMARVPLPKIGSFILDEKGYLALENRPLTDNITQLENEDIPVDIARDSTHTTVDAYVNDIFELHESRIRHQLNAVNDVTDGAYQTSALMVMKSVWSCFFRRDLRRGPFFLTLTDLHQSNVFVDAEWNVKYLIDLEWVCSQPVEMIQPPYWLTNKSVDTITTHGYEALHREFMEAFAEEEAMVKPPIPLHSIMQKCWETGTFWVSLALSSPTGLYSIFYKHIQPRFSKAHDEAAFCEKTFPFFGFDTLNFLQRKVKDKEQYDVRLREAFLSTPGSG